MNFEFLTITTKLVKGIKNKKLVIQGGIKKQDFQFLLFVNDKQQEFHLNFTPASGNFEIIHDLPKKIDEIRFCIKVDGVENTIFLMKPTFIKIILNKILRIIKKIIRKIIYFIVLLLKGVRFLWNEHHFLVPPVFWKRYFITFLKLLRRNVLFSYYDPSIPEDYRHWIRDNKSELIYQELSYKPLISILIPVYNVDRKYLSACLDSILGQSYDNFEVCLADDNSTKEETISTLKEYSQIDKRIKVVYRSENGHICKATNDALSMATGEFIALVDNDDVLDNNALYEVVSVLNKDRSIDMVYTDEDKLDVHGHRCEPHFKPDFSPDTLLSLNYICHLSVLRKSIVDELGGFTEGLAGAQDYDLFLRFSEVTTKIYHIPKILYHWRKIPGSTSMTIDSKSYAVDKGKLALENALKRRVINGEVLKDESTTYYKIKYDVSSNPLVSIIIPTRDYPDITDVCLKSIYEKTTYRNFEIILANNNSIKEETFELFNEYKQRYDNFKVVDINIEFNYSRINNEAIKEARGEYLVLLNNDTEIISPDWLEIMLGYGMQSHIGCVGPKLLYPDMSIQHGGVILGLGGVASHAYLNSDRYDTGIYGRLSVPYNYSAVTAACLLLKKSKYLEVEGLDEELKVAYNDIDLNIKLLSKGYYNVFIPQVEIIHHESKSRGYDTTSEKYKRFLIESELMYDKWDSEIKNDRFYNKNFSRGGWFILDKKKR